MTGQMRTTTEDMGSLRTATYYELGSLEEQRAATRTVCGIAARVCPDTAAKTARRVLEMLGLAPYTDGAE